MGGQDDRARQLQLMIFLKDLVQTQMHLKIYLELDSRENYQF